MTIQVRPADATHSESWLRMRCKLWPDQSEADLRQEVEQFFAGRVRHLEAVLFAHDPEGRVVGFAELNIRSYAEGCETDRVAFLEGWYVEPDHRRKGVGAALIEACERWAAENQCTEFASDARFDNAVARDAHLAVGFEEVEVIRCFRKRVIVSSR